MNVQEVREEIVIRLSIERMHESGYGKEGSYQDING